MYGDSSVYVSGSFADETKSLLFKLQLTGVITLRWMSLLHASRGANMSLDCV